MRLFPTLVDCILWLRLPSRLWGVFILPNCPRAWLADAAIETGSTGSFDVGEIEAPAQRAFRTLAVPESLISEGWLEGGKAETFFYCYSTFKFATFP